MIDVPGHNVKPNSTPSQVVESRESASETIRCFIGYGRCDSKSEILGPAISERHKLHNIHIDMNIAPTNTAAHAEMTRRGSSTPNCAPVLTAPLKSFPKIFGRMPVSYGL